MRKPPRPSSSPRTNASVRKRPAPKPSAPNTTSPKRQPHGGAKPRETPSEIETIKTIPAAIVTARAPRSGDGDRAHQRVIRSAERFAERAKLRRRLLLRRYILIGGVIAIVGAGFWAVFLSSIFALESEDITVTGAQKFVSEDSVSNVLSTHIGTPLARLDLDEIRDEVGELRGVSSAIVRRDWPSGVRVSLTERVPVAAVKSDDGFVLLDSDGVRVGTSEKAPSDLALAKVPLQSGREHSLAAVLTVLDEIPDALRGEITDIGADTRDTVYFILDDGARVEWGSSDDSPLKATVLEVLRQEKAQVYDVSAPTLPVTRE